MTVPLPEVDLAALLGTHPDEGVEAVVRAALRPLGNIGLYVLDRDLRLRLAEGSDPATNGYTTSMVRGRRFDDVLSAGMAAQVGPHFRAALAGHRRSFEASSPALERTYAMHAGPILGPSGEVLGCTALAIDVTERVQADRLRADDERRYRLLADTATEVVSLHSLDGAYRYVSPSVEGVLGYRPDDLLGRSAYPLMHPDDLPEVEAFISRMLSSEDAGALAYRKRDAHGRYVWLESVARAIRDEAGRVVEWRVSSRDISRRKELEREADAANAELRRRLAQTAAVARLGEHALEDPDLATLLDAAAAAVADTLEVPFTTVLELRGRGEPLLLRAGVGWPAGQVGRLVTPTHHDPDRALELLADGPVIAPADERFTAPLLDDHGITSSAHVLIGERDRPWGVLGAHAASEREFDGPDRDFLQAVAHVVGDAVARRRAEERMRHDALHDPLTGLANRALLVDRVTQALRRRGAGRIGVFLLDLDEFKVVNESLGHAVGDQILTEVGPRLAAALRPGDTVARFSGDSFAIVCEDITDEADAQRLAERLTGAFAHPFVIDGEQLFVAASVGVVVSTGSERAEDLVRDADAAMFRAKASGHGGYELFDPRQRERSLARLRTESDLRRALGAGELRVQYQPVWSLPERKLAGVEALVRWQHPERGLVPPGDFIPVAEESGLIVPLGAWVLREACRQLAAWRRTSPAASSLKLRVNLSARQVTQPGLLGVVAGALEDHGIEAGAVGLEITENLLLQDSDDVARTLRGLKELGVALVLDDFGTGYSSLSYLKRFPIDQLKIDRSFITGLVERDEDRALVAAIVGMTAALGLTVVPEGVETAEQLAILIDLGCEFAQGFLLARPLEADAVAALL